MLLLIVLKLCKSNFTICKKIFFFCEKIVFMFMIVFCNLNEGSINHLRLAVKKGTLVFRDASNYFAER